MSKENKTKEMEDEVLKNKDQNEIDQETTSEMEKEEELSVEEQLKEDLGKEKDKFLRLFAEFENYKKRTSKERMDLFKTAGQEVILSLLPVMDDFDRALAEISKSEDDGMYQGVLLINNKLRETLKSKGLLEVEVKEGDDFDAEIHDAVTQIPAPDEKLKGKIIDVVQKGYKLGDKIIRHPKVVVGN
ncbi:nucleotide exchange factor GrpE [Arenibacter latericius]|uniref:nucleotide exchange factor GrpE n=1 Tax=Arenibacter latericius TaxID=86104 RepID=UPI000408E416|nr:nucleotide exchange factor GrpE [Arenibacter latericius]MDX1365127.1 nucleotide exchange factor GrpE [Arenibacter latericius]